MWGRDAADTTFSGKKFGVGGSAVDSTSCRVGRNAAQRREAHRRARALPAGGPPGLVGRVTFVSRGNRPTAGSAWVSRPRRTSVRSLGAAGSGLDPPARRRLLSATLRRGRETHAERPEVVETIRQAGSRRLAGQQTTAHQRSVCGRCVVLGGSERRAAARGPPARATVEPRWASPPCRSVRPTLQRTLNTRDHARCPAEAPGSAWSSGPLATGPGCPWPACRRRVRTRAGSSASRRR